MFFGGFFFFAFFFCFVFLFPSTQKFFSRTTKELKELYVVCICLLSFSIFVLSWFSYVVVFVWALFIFFILQNARKEDPSSPETLLDIFEGDNIIIFLIFMIITSQFLNPRAEEFRMIQPIQMERVLMDDSILLSPILEGHGT